MANNSFQYNGEWFTPFRKMTQTEREQPLENIREKMIRFSNEEFEKYWDMDEFYQKAKGSADLFWWHGKLILPGWDTFYILNGWL